MDKFFNLHPRENYKILQSKFSENTYYAAVYTDEILSENLVKDIHETNFEDFRKAIKPYGMYLF